MPDSQPCVKWVDGGGFRFRTRARVFYVKTAETRVSGGCINLGGKRSAIKNLRDTRRDGRPVDSLD